MTLPEFALDYSSCSYDELRRFVKDRTDRKPKGRGGKGAPKNSRLIHILQELDRKMEGFRFLDMPAELRNNVYEMVLTPHEPNDTALLRVCKQIHREGSPILHAGTIAELHITFVKGWHKGESIHHYRVHFDRPCCTSHSRGLVQLDQSRYTEENSTIDAFSYHLQVVGGFQAIHLSLHVSEHSSEWLRRTGRRQEIWGNDLEVNFLRALVRTCKGLRCLRITFGHRRNGKAVEVDGSLALRTLKPLEALSEKVELDIRGMPDFACEHLQRSGTATS